MNAIIQVKDLTKFYGNNFDVKALLNGEEVKEGESDVTWWGVKVKQFINLKLNPLRRWELC
jgi:hypothetical protein